MVCNKFLLDQTVCLCFSFDAHLSENSGPIKVRSYTMEKSDNKLDYFGDESSSVSHESLLATVILYVSNTTQGGELLFPNAEVSKAKRIYLAQLKEYLNSCFLSFSFR